MSIVAKPADVQSLQYQLPGRVNFGWITESWQLFAANVGPWIVGVLAMVGLPLLVFLVFYVFVVVSALSGSLGAFPGSHGQPPGLPPGTVPYRTTTSWTPLPPNALFAGGFGRIILDEYAAGLVITVYVTFFYGSLFRMAVRQVRGLPIEVRDVFRGWPLFGRMLGATFLLAFGLIGLEAVLTLPVLLVHHFRPLSPGMMLGLGVAGWVLVFAFSLVSYGLLLPAFSLMADGDGVLKALRRSVRGMKSQWLPATGLVFVLILLVYASEMACFVGLLATIPMVFLICALAYRDLVGMPDLVPPAPPAWSVPRPPQEGVWPPPPGAFTPPPPILGESEQDP